MEHFNLMQLTSLNREKSPTATMRHVSARGMLLANEEVQHAHLRLQTKPPRTLFTANLSLEISLGELC